MAWNPTFRKARKVGHPAPVSQLSTATDYARRGPGFYLMAKGHESPRGPPQAG
jgi:hypothetical protein